MKKIVLAILLLFSYNAFAKTELSFSFGKESFSSKENIISPTSAGVRGDFYLDDLYHLDFGYDNLGSVAYTNSNKKVKIDRFYTQFSADGDEEYHVVPTLSIGIGLERQKGVKNSTQPFLSLGVGFRYNVSRSFNFLFGTKALWKTDDSVLNYTGSFGLGYMIDNEPVNNEKAGEEVIIPKKKLSIEPRANRVVDKTINQQNCTVSNSFRPSKTQVRVLSPIDKLEAKSAKRNTNRVVMIDDKERAVLESNHTIRKNRRYRVYQSQGYFIQVGAYSKYRPTNTLNKLARSGYHIILRHNRNGVTKALVGPYSSIEVAYRKLPAIKRIVPQAFLYKGN